MAASKARSPRARNSETCGLGPRRKIERRLAAHQFERLATAIASDLIALNEAVDRRRRDLQGFPKVLDPTLDCLNRVRVRLLSAATHLKTAALFIRFGDQASGRHHATNAVSRLAEGRAWLMAASRAEALPSASEATRENLHMAIRVVESTATELDAQLA